MTQPARPEPTEPEVSSCEPVEHPHLSPVPDAPAEQHNPETEPELDATEPSDEADGEQPESTSWQDWLLDIADRAREFATPPDVWSEDRPSLGKVYRYARYSEQLPPTGPARVATIAYSGIAVSVHAVAYTVAWLFERTSRAGIFAGLLTLAAVFPPTRMVLTVLATPVYYLIELITNY